MLIMLNYDCCHVNNAKKKIRVWWTLQIKLLVFKDPYLY